MPKTIFHFIIFCFLFLTVITQNTYATKYYVNDAYNAASDIYCQVAGNNANNGLSPSTPKATLSNILSTYAASFAASDTIYIDAGNYSDKDLSSPINGVVIKGAGMNATTFTNPGSDNFFMRIDDNNTILMDFKLTRYDDIGGAGPGGQAIGVYSNKTGIQIINVQINDCRAGSALSGYPIEIASGANVKFNGGGLTCNRYTSGGGIETTNATVEIRNYQFLGNSRDQSWATIGAALHINGGTVNIFNTRFEQNDATGDGVCPGLYINGGTVNVFDCNFDKNTSLLSYDSNGGTIYVLSGTVKITRSIISNHTQTGGSKTLSGGISVAGGTTTIDSCTFSGNRGKNVNDVYITNGSVIARNCTFSSIANQIQDNGSGTFTISDCGNPSESGTAVVRSNTNNPTYTANPSLPSYLNQTCVTVPCTAPTISSVASSNSICSGNTFISNLTSSTSPITYSWTSSAQAGISGNTASGTGNIADVLTNSTSNDLTVTYTITPYSGACTGTSTNFIVTVQAKPSVTASANLYSICNGSQANLTGSGSGLTNYTWSPSTGLSSTSGSNVSATVTGNVIYTLTATNASGCSNTDTVTLTVKNNPTITASTALYSACYNNSITLQATGTGGNSYSWSPSTGLSATTGSTVSATINGNIIYTVTATGSNGCVSNDTLTIRSKDLPSVAAFAGSTPICNGSSTTLSASGALTFSWYPNQSLSSNIGSTITANPVSDIIYTVMGTAANGCTNTDTVAIVILTNDDPTFTFSPFTQCVTGANPIPVVNTIGGVFSGSSGLIIDPNTGQVDLLGSGVGNYTITYQTPNTNSCPSDTTFNFQITNGYNADFAYTPDTVCGTGTNISAILGVNANHGIYTSYPNGLVFSNASFGEIDPNLSTPGTYTVVNTIAASGTCLEQKDSTEITILQLPNSNVTGTPAELCFGASPLTLNPSISGGIFTGNGVSNGTFDATIAGVGNHTITYTIDTLVGTTTCTNSNAFNITVNPLPDASFIGLATPVCDGSTSQGLSATSPGGIFTGTGITGNTFDPTISGPGTFNITYTVTNSFNCTDSTTQLITVNALPIIDNIISTNALSFCFGDSTYLIANSTSNITSYSWAPGNINNDSILVTNSGIYTLIITDDNQCSSDTQSTTVTVYSLPSTPTITAVGPTNICFGDSVLLIANSNGALDYSWLPYGGSNDSIYVSSLGTDTFYVYGNSVNKCLSDPSEDSIVVNVFPPASTPLLTAPNGNTACVGDSVLLVATSVGAYNYTWNPGGVNNDSIYVSSIGNFNYNVSVSSNSNCASNGTSNSVGVSIYNIPANPTISSPNGLIACEGDTVVLIANSTGADHYTWTPAAADNDTIYITSVGTNNYNVSVSNANNCAALSASANVNVTINAAPANPVLTTPNGSSVCDGDSVLIVASANGASNFTWTPANINNDSIYVSAVGTFNYQVSVSSSNNCAASNASNTVTATVSPRPTDPTVNVPNGQVACEGDTIVLIANSTGADHYTWSPTAADNDTIYITSVGTNNYNVTVSNTNNCAALNASANVNVTINAAPGNPVLTTPNGSSVCDGDSVLIIASANGASNFTWTPANINNDSIYVSTVGTFNYQVSVSSSNNCSASSASNNVTITINPRPTDPTISAPNGLTACEGDTVVLIANSSGADHYTWSPATIDNDTIFITGIGSTSYNVSVSNNTNCSALNASANVNVTINPSPTIPVLTTPNGSSACEGDSVLIVVNSNGASNYTWTPNNINNDSIYVSTVGTFNYQVAVSSNNNCNAANNSNIISVTINSIQNLVANNDTIVCKGSNLLLSATNGNTYTWIALNSGATFLNANAQNTNVIINNSTTIVVADLLNTCSVNDTINISIHNNPSPIISATPTTGNDPLPVQFTFTNSNDFQNYYWGFDDGTDSSLNANPSHVYENGGTYYPTIYITTLFGCKDSAKIEIVVDPKFEVIFPNVFTPNDDGKNDVLFIKIRNGKLVYTEIYDRWGLMMYEQAGENVYWDGYTMGGQEASVGVYYYIITIEKFDGEIEKFTGSFSLFR